VKRIAATCHVHSTWSYDGSWSLAQLAEKFGNRGTQALLMTEHDKGFSPERLAEFRLACTHASSDTVVVMPGVEYSDAANRVHVLVWGPVPFLGEGRETSEVLEAVAAHGGVAVLAHPSRRDAWRCVQPRWGARLLGVEAWNRKYDGWAPSTTASQILQQAGSVPFVGLDFHTDRQLFPLSMTLEIEGVASEESIMASLRHRRCTPSAFGLPLDDIRLERSLPWLRAAERGRSGLAAARRRVRARFTAATR
jgi:hypothetical protein